MQDYDIRAIFEEMELELIRSMKRNLSRHQEWEKDEGMNWTMWQVEQLKTLEEFKKNNQEIFTKKFTHVNNEMAKFLEEHYKTAGFEQEKAILKELSKGRILNDTVDKGLEGGFFSLNEGKIHALIDSVMNDMERAENAMLRMVDDQYRKTIFKAQVMANSGAFTLKQSIDEATKDFLKAGINCIEYKNGRRVNIATYAEMSIRTANKRAVLISEGEVRKAYGVHTVRISKYGACSETCLPWQGRIYIDDVYSDGTKEEAQEKNLPLLSEAIVGGLFHPNCKHRATTYFYDVKKALGKLKDDGVEVPLDEQEHRKNKLHIQQQKRLETGSLDPHNISLARQRKQMWIEKDKLLNINDEWLPFRFDKYQEKVNNSDDIVDKYYQELNVQALSTDFESLIKKELKIIPTNDLDILKQIHITIVESQSESSYAAAGKILSINSLNYTPGILAHELAHISVDEYDLYRNSELKDIMENVLKNAEIKSKRYNGESYISLKSNLFIRPYQGRTYIKTEDFINKHIRLKYTDMEEYVSVGYETFVTNPELLYDKDRKLYHFFVKGGIHNG